MSRPEAEAPPRTCPACGQDLSEHPYYRERPGKTARKLRMVAVALLPAMSVVYLALLFFGGYALGFGTGHGYWAVAVIGGPSLVLYAVSRLLPRVRLVICLRCSWSQEYPPTRTLGRAV